MKNYDLSKLSFKDCTFKIIGVHKKLFKLHDRADYLNEQVYKTHSEIKELNEELVLLDRHQEIMFHKEKLWMLGHKERNKMNVEKEIERVKKLH